MIRTARKAASMGQKTLAVYLGLQDHSSITRKEQGKTPWTYDEVWKLSQILPLQGLAQDVQHTGRPHDPAVELLRELLYLLPPDQRRAVIDVAARFIEAMGTTPPTKAKAKVLRGMAQNRAKSR